MPDPNVLTKITVQDKQKSVYSGGDDDPDRGRYREDAHSRVFITYVAKATALGARMRQGAIFFTGKPLSGS
ncbi:MAG: hypothetical protein LUG27_06965 [Clostridiales bacterium]|nr:hypothetical protein [Clostridiales bacterium]